LLPEEIVPSEEFGTLRQPKGIPPGVNWAATDLGTHFLVVVDDKLDTIGELEGGLEIKNKAEFKDISKENKKVPQKIALDLAVTITDYEKGRIKI